MRCSKISRVIGQGQGSGGGGEITRIVGQAWSDPSAHSPPLPAVPGSGPPSSPPESSSLRAAPGAERAPLPAPTATGSPKTWPARTATPRQAAPGSDLRESRSERSINHYKAGSPRLGPAPRWPRGPRPQACRVRWPLPSPTLVLPPVRDWNYWVGSTGLWRCPFCLASA